MQKNFAKVWVLFTRNIAKISGEKVWFFGQNFKENSLSHMKVRTHTWKFAIQTAKLQWDFVHTETKIQEISLSHTKVLTRARKFANLTTVFRWEFVRTEIKIQEPIDRKIVFLKQHFEISVSGSYLVHVVWMNEIYNCTSVNKHLRAISTTCSIYSSGSLYIEIQQRNPLTILILIMTSHTSKIQCSCFFPSRVKSVILTEID